MPLSGGGGAGGGLLYHDVGDSDAYDWTLATLTADGTWYELDVSSVVTDLTAVRVELRLIFKDSVLGKYAGFRERGNLLTYNNGGLETLVANKWHYCTTYCVLDDENVIEYRIDTGMDSANIAVRGWWYPA